MLKKGLCLLMALLLCFAALAEDVEIYDERDAEAMPAEVNLSLDLLSDASSGDGGAPLDEGEAQETGDPETPEEPELKLSATKLTIGVKETCTALTATLSPEDSAQKITWSSDNKKIVKVNAKTGALTGVKAGTTTVRAKTSGGLSKSCKVTVRKAPGKVTLNVASLTLSVGQTYALKATLPSKTGSTLTFTSSKKKVAAVDAASGVITALVPGSATITVKTFNKKKATCKVTVVAEPDQVLLPETLTISQKEHRTIAASALDKDGKATKADYTYSAKKGTGSIRIDAKTGEVVGESVGTAFIRVSTQNGVTTHLSDGERVETVCAVTVVEGPDKVVLAADSVTIGLSQSFSLKPVVLAADGSEMEDATFTVASSAPKKLTASGKGVIKGVKKGSYTVTVTACNGVKATCKVKVVSAPTKVSLSPKSPEIGLGETDRLSVSLPKGTMGSYTFSSSAKDVVAVDNEGNITGLKEGSAVVKVRTHNGKTAKVTVKVVKGPDFLSLNGEYELVYDALNDAYRVIYTKTLNKGKTFQITYENEYLTRGSVVSYTSDNPEVATVSSKGLVKAVESGAANITVRSTSGAEATLAVTVPGTPAAKIAFDAAFAEVQVGRTVAAPRLRGQNIDAAALSEAVYASGNRKVFTVDWNESENRWELTGVKAGSAKLTATAGDATAELTVTVTKAGTATAIRFESDLLYMKAGEEYAPRVLDDFDGVVDAALESADESVVSVEGGKLVAVAEGSAAITAAFGDLTAAMTVVVKSDDATVSLDVSCLTLGVGQRYALKAQVNGDGGAARLTYASSNTSVASVISTGRIIARGVGLATITVTEAGGASASCEVTVRPAPTMISVVPGAVSERLEAGGKQLEWSFGASDQVGSVSFSSADEKIASVSDSGYVSFNGVGATTVSAVTYNGLVADISVTVLPNRTVTDNTTYRLFAAYSYFSASYGKEYLPFTRNNGKSMASVFGKSKVGDQTYSTKVMGNPSKTQVLTGISSFFANADENDVSIVYLCSHGHNNKSSYRSYRMSLPGYSSHMDNPNYYMTSAEIFSCIKRIRGSVVLILDSCYSGTFIEDMQSKLNAEGGRIAVLTAASNTSATYYKTSNTNKAVDFFTFFLLQGLGYSEKDGWWTNGASGGKGSYPGYLAADAEYGNWDGIVTLGEFYGYASKCIAKNIPVYMKKDFYWGDKKNVQQPRFYSGSLKNLVIYQPK